MSRSNKAAVIALGSGMSMATSLVLAAVLSRYLSEREYGIYRQAMIPVRLMVPILTMGLPLAVYHFYPKDGGRQGRAFSNNSFLLLCIGVIWLVITQLGGAEVMAGMFGTPEASHLYRISSVIVFSIVVVASLTPTLVSLNKEKWIAAVSSLEGGLRLTVCLVAFYFVGSGESVLYASAAVFMLMLLLKGVLMCKAVGGSWVKPDVMTMTAHLRFGAVLGVSSMLGTVHREIDKTIVSVMTSPEEFAVFVNGAQEVPFIGVIQGAVVAVLLSEISRLLNQGKLVEAHQLWKRAVSKVAVLFIPMAGGLVLVAPEMMVILFGKSYESSATIFSIYTLLLPLRSISYGAVCIAAGRNDLVLKGSLIGLLSSVILTPVGIYYYGPVGAAVANVLSIGVVMMPWYLGKIKSIFSVGLTDVVRWRVLMKSALCVTLSYAAINILEDCIALNSVAVAICIKLMGYCLFILVAYIAVNLMSVASVGSWIKSMFSGGSNNSG